MSPVEVDVSLVWDMPHNGTGRGSAFVQRQRYVSLHSLETAVTTADLSMGHVTTGLGVKGD